MSFLVRLAKPGGAPKYIKASHFGLWKLVVTWERSSNPSKLSSQALEACTLNGLVISCCWFISTGQMDARKVGLGVSVGNIPLATLTMNKNITSKYAYPKIF